MTTGRINQVSFSFFRNLKFAHGPAVDEFFTREMVKIAVCAPNPDIWPRPMNDANQLRQAYEYWQRVDFAMAESHGTREFIGGGKLVPHPETAPSV